MKAGEKPAYDESYINELNFIERYGLDFLKSECPGEETNTRKWDKGQIDKIRRIERKVLWLAALSGAVSGGIIAGMELVLRSWLVGDAETADWDEMIPFYAVNLALVGLITVIEIIYLYWLILSNVARMACVGSLGLDNRPDDVLTTGISRAAMDMPNPHTKFYGIDPYHRISGLKLMFYTIAYRAKVGATSIILRLMMRRVLARAAVRSVVPFVAIPLYAVWNVVICRWVVREARGRAAAPIAISQLLKQFDDAGTKLGTEEKKMVITLIAETIMRTMDSHPSFLLLLSELVKKFELEEESLDLDFDWKKSCERLAELDDDVQDLALDTLRLSVVLDGSPTRLQKKLVGEVYIIFGRSFDEDELKRGYNKFIDGQGMAGFGKE